MSIPASSGRPGQSLYSQSTLGCVLPTLSGIALLLAFCAPRLSYAQISEYQVKAAYLYNFAKIAEWPAQTQPSAGRILCVFGGDDDFIMVLRTTVAGKPVNGHAIVIKQVRTAAQMRSCQLVFFRGQLSEVRSAIAELSGAGVLLVGEDPDFLTTGGMVNLLLRSGKVSYEVNLEAMAREGLRLGDGGQTQGAAASASTTSSGSRQLKSQTTPTKPELASRMGLSGVVQLKAVVRPDGTVKDVQVVGGHPLLAAAAVQTVLKWRFEPASRETVEPVKISFGN